MSILHMQRQRGHPTKSPHTLFTVIMGPPRTPVLPPPPSSTPLLAPLAALLRSIPSPDAPDAAADLAVARFAAVDASKFCIRVLGTPPAALAPTPPAPAPAPPPPPLVPSLLAPSPALPSAPSSEGGGSLTAVVAEPDKADGAARLLPLAPPATVAAPLESPLPTLPPPPLVLPDAAKVLELPCCGGARAVVADAGLLLLPSFFELEFGCGRGRRADETRRVQRGRGGTVVTGRQYRCCQIHQLEVCT